MVSRITLPEEFYDIVSADLLVQPEPQYFYCKLFLEAIGQELTPPDAVGMPVLGHQVPGQGANYLAHEDMQLMLANTLPQGLFATKVDFDGAPGHTMRFNRPAFLNSTYTQAARRIATNQTVVTVPIEPGSEQVPLTIQRFGGPYDNTNSRIAPYPIDEFDASMGVHNLAKLIGLQLKRDFHRTVDAFWNTLFDLAATTIYPEGFAADNDITGKGQAKLTFEQINRTAKAMDEANLPTLPDGRRVLVMTPTGKKYLKDDPQLARYVQFFKEANPMFPGYMGSTPEFHMFYSTTLNQVQNSSSINVHYAHAIAPGAALAGMGQAPEVRSATDDNYGMTPKVIWLAHLALGLADNRFVYSVRYGQDVS